jgi:hypothetical protein
MRSGKRGRVTTNSRQITPTGTGGRGRGVCLYGCLALIAIVLILSAAGVWAIHRAADGATPLTGGLTIGEVFDTGERFVAGLMDGSIRPEAAVQIVCRLFTDMSDGVLTAEEIWSILGEIGRACDVRI